MYIPTLKLHFVLDKTDAEYKTIELKKIWYHFQYIPV